MRPSQDEEGRRCPSIGIEKCQEHFLFALNCYLPTDSEETYIVVDASTYDVNEVGKNVPQGLRDEIQEKMDEGLLIDLCWNDVGLDELWA